MEGMKNEKKRVFCVISHTHWDREWYFPFEKFRLRLVDLIDRLILLIDRYPEYVFHLDAQTIVLEDYLDIRPQNRGILEKLISDGNIIVGPWYLQNDFFLTSGEATIRNLLEGIKLANQFGACAMVGYAPDQFGHISQMPQILNNFGIDNFLFARGLSTYAKDEGGNVYRCASPIELQWEGADGSRVLAVNMRLFYNNAQRIPEDVEKARILTDLIEREYDGMIATEVYLLMNGVDHLEPQDTVLKAIKDYNEAYGDSAVMKQCTMEQYMQEVKESLCRQQKELPVYKGELRRGHHWDILSGTLSSRHYLKVANVRLQNAFEQNLEPLYAMLELAGCKGVYPYDQLRYGWKKLIQNHPHDSICGCSRDEVHKHMEDNFERLGEFIEEMYERGMTELCYHNDILRKFPDGKYYINVVNTTDVQLSGVVKLELDFIAEDKIENFRLEDADGKSVEYAVISKETVERDVFSPLNLPGRIWVDRYLVYVKVNDVQPYSVKGIMVLLAKSEVPYAKDIVLRAKEKENVCAILENDFIRAVVNERGRVDVCFKQRGLSFEDVFAFEDKADRGDSYNYYDAHDTPVSSREFAPKIEIIEQNALVGRVKITWELKLPVCYDFQDEKRSDETSTVTAEIILELKSTDEMLILNYRILNTCKDHRLRLLVNSGFLKASCMADTPFDIMEREDAHWWVDPISQAFPNTSFVSLEEKGKGIAVLTEGAHEAEHLKPGTLALTLVRSTGVINREWNLKPGGGRQWNCPANQCLREISGRLAFVGYNGSVYEAQLPQYVKAFRTPLKAMCVPADRKRFTGGRTAVQDTRLSELFYLPEAYPDVWLRQNQSQVLLEGRNLTVSALKLGEDRSGVIFRFYNYGVEKEIASVTAEGEIYRTNMAENEKEYLGSNFIKMEVGAKKVVTLYIQR